MWKIVSLRLKNFIHIYSGIGKTDISINLEDKPNTINIFIGKMGSGKSAILGHLQPFATYGTLDIRNQDDLIIPEEEGLKEIVFLHDNDIYQIQHRYLWNKNSRSHNIKSFIQLNGVELNENGNSRSFKEIIKTEFGIDQNFLRILRLGPNVANLINMKSSERKTFIASLLKDTEIYTMLSQKLTEDYRAMNSTLSVLSNKLVSLSSDKENELMSELEDLEHQLKMTESYLENSKTTMFKLSGANETLKSLPGNISLEDAITFIEKSINEDTSLLVSLQEKSKKLPNANLQEVSVEYGEVSNTISRLKESILATSQKINILETEITKLRDFILISKNSAQISELRARASMIEEKYENSKRKLTGFHYRYDYRFLNNFLNTLDQFQISLEDMCVNSKEMISKLYQSDGSLKTWAGKRRDMLIGRRVNLQKLSSNIQFSAEYKSPIPMYVPPLCPTKDCPYRQTHPDTIKKLNPNVKSEITEIQNQLAKLDKDIAICEELGNQYPKMQYLKKSWESILPILVNTNTIREKNLFKILTDLSARCYWYDYDSLVSIIEMSKLHEEFVQLENSYYQVQNELLKFGKLDLDEKEKELNEKEKHYNDLLVDLESLHSEEIKQKSRKMELEELIQLIQNSDSLQKEIDKLNQNILKNTNLYEEYKNRKSEISSNLTEINILKGTIQSTTIEYNKISDRVSKLQMIMRDIASTKSSYQEYLDERNMIKLIMDSVSSKDGIPLILIKVFLDECKEIVNDLISDIFDDQLEILDFIISENTNEFRIPYASNGVPINDIESASQGQQAIISIALSFALCRKSMFDYNILLLDEIDNSIYKSDREKFIGILFKQMRALGTEQAFLITHNDIFQQSMLPINILMTTHETIDVYQGQEVIQI